MKTWGLSLDDGFFALSEGFVVTEKSEGLYVPLALRAVAPGLFALGDVAVPVQNLTTSEILYGARTTSFRYELLAHDSSTGTDSLVGYLDGVDGGRLTWSSQARIKKSGHLLVRDVLTAPDGFTRFRDLLDLSAALNVTQVRIRPVVEIEGLPDIPLGVYLLSRSPESWSGTGRSFEVELLDRTSVLDQDAFEETFTAGTDEPIVEIARQVVASAGEAMVLDESDTRALQAPMSWGPDKSKLTIVNELLEVLDYRSLWMDGQGQLRATPYVRPAARPLHYSMLTDPTGPLVRQLRDGEEAIYAPEWTFERDSYRIPNKVIAVENIGGDGEPLIGFATNEDPASPWSYSRRGDRWVLPVDGPIRVDVPDFSGEADPEAAGIAFLESKARDHLIRASSVQAGVDVRCLPIPVDLLDAMLFGHTPAGVEGRYTVQRAMWELSFDGLLSLNLLEVVDL